MRDFFNMDGPLFQFLSKVADIALLNMLFIICSIPIFTIGASLTAMAYVTLKMAEGEDGYITKKFFKSFRENFKQATLMWLPLLALLIVLIMDLQIAQQVGGTGRTAFILIVMVGAVFWFFVVSYAFPLQARFENKIGQTLRNALYMSIANTPRMLLMTVIFFGSIAVTLLNAYTLSWGILVWLICGFAVMSRINSALQIKLFHKFMPEKEPEDTTDNWKQPDNPEDMEPLQYLGADAANKRKDA